jgi:hypothetical protein
MIFGRGSAERRARGSAARAGEAGGHLVCVECSTVCDGTCRDWRAYRTIDDAAAMLTAIILPDCCGG